MLRRDRHSVVAVEPVGPYTLLRVERGDLEPGVPGQFFMLEAPGRVLPRPMSLSLAPPGELGFLFEAIGPGTTPSRSSTRATASGSSARSGTGSGWTSTVRCSSAGGSARAFPVPVPEPRSAAGAILGFRTRHHAEAAELVPNAEVVVEPTRVTELLEPGYDVLACGPAPMLSAVRELAPEAQLAWEAPMACGYGACYGCVVEVGGQYKRLCLEGPVLAA